MRQCPFDSIDGPHALLLAVDFDQCLVEDGGPESTKSVNSGSLVEAHPIHGKEHGVVACKLALGETWHQPLRVPRDFVKFIERLAGLT